MWWCTQPLAQVSQLTAISVVTTLTLSGYGQCTLGVYDTNCPVVEYAGPESYLYSLCVVTPTPYIPETTIHTESARMTNNLSLISLSLYFSLSLSLSLSLFLPLPSLSLSLSPSPISLPLPNIPL